MRECGFCSARPSVLRHVLKTRAEAEFLVVDTTASFFRTSFRHCKTEDLNLIAYSRVEKGTVALAEIKDFIRICRRREREVSRIDFPGTVQYPCYVVEALNFQEAPLYTLV